MVLLGFPTIGQRFFAILDSCFPPGHPLHQTFNGHMVQLSYRTTLSLEKVKALPDQWLHNSNSNCRGGVDCCPVDRAGCKDGNVVNQAGVTAVDKSNEGYVGMCAPSKYANHKTDFKHTVKQSQIQFQESQMQVVNYESLIIC